MATWGGFPFAFWRFGGYHAAMLGHIFGFFMILYVAILRLTCRVTIHGQSHPAQFWQQQQPVVLAHWHGRVMGVPYYTASPLPTRALISLHKDGRLMATIGQWFGIKAVDGSSKQRGAQAVREMMTLGKQGHNLMLTPDAKPQATYTCAPGVAELARLTGLPIIPCTISTTFGKQLNTRNRFVLPLPFGHIHIAFGIPLTLPPKADRSTRAGFLAEVEQHMQTLTEETDKLCGQEVWSA